MPVPLEFSAECSPATPRSLFWQVCLGHGGRGWLKVRWVSSPGIAFAPDPPTAAPASDAVCSSFPSTVAGRPGPSSLHARSDHVTATQPQFTQTTHQHPHCCLWGRTKGGVRTHAVVHCAPDPVREHRPFLAMQAQAPVHTASYSRLGRALSVHARGLQARARAGASLSRTSRVKLGANALRSAAARLVMHCHRIAVCCARLPVHPSVHSIPPCAGR